MITALRDDGSKGYTMVPQRQGWFIKEGHGDDTPAAGEVGGKTMYINVDRAFPAKYYSMAWIIGHESAHNVGIRGDVYRWYPEYRHLTAEQALGNADSYIDFAHPR